MPIKKTLIFMALGASVYAIEIIDAMTGLIPNLTIAYLVPVSLATLLLGLSWGLVLALIAMVASSISNYLLHIEVGPALVIDGILLFAVMASVTLLLDRLQKQLALVRTLEARRDHDLEQAREVQKSVFTPMPEKTDGFEISHSLIFAREVGGDYYHVAERDNELVFCVADITGKSVSAALLSALLHETVREAFGLFNDPSRIVGHINERLFGILPRRMFITLFCGVISRNELAFVNAGHEPALLHSPETGETKLLKSAFRLPIGVMPTLEIASSHKSLRPGDLLVVFTDGVTDSLAARGEPYGLLTTVLERNAASQTDEIIETIVEECIPGKKNPIDDILIMCIKRSAQ